MFYVYMYIKNLHDLKWIPIFIIVHMIMVLFKTDLNAKC